jgi:uncharacterized caspase-like protein
MANQTCISIGIDRYQFLPPIGYGLADAEAVEHFFIDAAGWNPSQCLLLTDTSPNSGDRSTYPDRQNIQRWIEQWSWEKLHAGDLLWFFFSGCGISFEGEDYLIPIDGNVEDLTNTCISLTKLYQQFQEIGVNAYVFLDANRSQHLPLSTGIGEVTSKLAQDYQIPTFISCQSHEFSHEDAGLGHGLFTTALLEALNYHPDLNLDTINTYLTSRLAELSEHHWKPLQTPVAILPTGASIHRPVFSATTQSSISSMAADAAYVPPTPPSAREDVYAPYTPPTPPPVNREDDYAPYPPPVTILSPEMAGSSAIVLKPQFAPTPPRIPHWASVGFLLGLMVAAGGVIYALSGQYSHPNQEPIPKPAASSVTTPLAITSTATAIAQFPALAQAAEKIKPNDATSHYVAILDARKITATTPAAAAAIKDSIDLWSVEIARIAEGFASQQKWKLAIGTAKMVPADASNYPTVQGSMANWQSRL